MDDCAYGKLLVINGIVSKKRLGGFRSLACTALASPEEELESADKGPEIIVPLYLLERVQCQAAKNLESWGVKVKSIEL